MRQRSRKYRAEQAWIVLIGGVVTYEVMAPAGQLLTDGARRAHQRHPTAVTLAVMATAMHLLGALPGTIDPYTHTGRLATRALRWTGIAKFKPELAEALIDREALRVGDTP